MSRFISITVIVIGCAFVLTAREPDQKNMLATTSTRFAVTDLVWPAEHGNADVCLWADDKIAAVSLGVDDNTVPDHDWWMGMADTYGFKMTWWAVTDWFETEANPSFYGTYADFQELYDAGHEVGSHSVNHSCYDTTSDYWDEEMRVSNGHLESNIPGLKVHTYAGPCGKMPDPDTTAKYYIAARGVTGGINGANNTAYYQTLVCGGEYDPADQLSQTSTGNWWWRYRGWRVMFWHYLQGNNAVVESTVLMPLAAKKDSIWIGRFDRVAQYGQSRDTHTLNVSSVAADLVTFTLTDSMNDTLFTYPLTVKVRLNNDWDTCVATQNGSAVEASIVEHESNTYALVKAVPDQGEVTLSKVGVSFADTPVITPDGGSGVCSVLVSISCADTSADIYFTIDGMEPDSTATPYTGPFSVRDDATVKAKAYNGTDLPSRVASASFSVAAEAADVVISPAGGSFDDTVTVTLGCATAGAVIRYTLDGSEPDESDAAYADGIVLTADAAVKARAFHICLAAGATATETYSVDIPVSGVRRQVPPGVPGFTGAPVYFDCRGQVFQTLPQVPGVYFVYDGTAFRKTVVTK